MVTLKLAIDATGVRNGASETKNELRGITQEAQKTADALSIYGSGAVVRNWEVGRESVLKYGKAIEAVGEVTQVGGRVRLLGEEIKNLGSGFGSAAGVAQTFAGALVDVAQITNKTEGSLKGFAAALRANPILAAAGVISLIASAMSLFASDTRDANSELSKQIRLQEELRRASLDLAQQIQRDRDLSSVGFPIDEQAAGYARARRLSEVASGLAGQQGYQTFADLQSLTGLREDQLRNLAPAGGIAQSTRTAAGQTLGGMTFTTDLGLTNEAARQVLLLLAENIKTNADLLPSGPSGGTGPVGPPQRAGEDPYLMALRDYQRSSAQPNLDAAGFPAAQPYGPPIDFEQLRQAEQAQADFNRELERTRQLGVDVGTALGNSFFAFTQNVSNARDVLVGLLQQLSAIAQQRIVQGFANGVGNLFASTQTQQQATRTPGTE